MHELPESLVLAQQLKDTVLGRRISSVTADASPHKFAWYHGDPQEYPQLLVGKRISGTSGFGSYVEIAAEDCRIALAEGASIRYLSPGDKRPDKHQLLVELDDGSALLTTVRMYGGIFAFREGDFANDYYSLSKEALSPLSDAFDFPTFRALLPEGKPSLSVKAFLATEQRIPGLGNGVLQDILFRAHLHPRRKMSSLTEDDWQQLFVSLKETLAAMVAGGGRDVEKDLFNRSGGYLTALSAKTVGKPCLVCGCEIRREAYLGGNVTFCPHCQPLA